MGLISLEAFEERGDAVLRETVSGHEGDGLRLDLLIIVVVSNLSNSMNRELISQQSP